MRIHNENTPEFIKALAVAIAKDPASLENWRCLHIGHADHVSKEWYETTLQRLKDTHKDLDCEVVHCADQDILFISRHLQVDELYEISDEFIRASYDHEGKAGEIALYDLFRDWRTVRQLLMAKTGDATITPPAHETHNFGEVDSLKEVFSEAKQRRSTRMPLHVMVVEDDLLTRRIVSAAFKDNYAIITAANAEEAIANYLFYAPDIVFLDIGLPDVNGFDVLHQILASDQDAFVVMFSGNSYLDNVTAALSQGASGFIAKPFKKEKMRHYIEESAAHHHKLQ